MRLGLRDLQPFGKKKNGVFISFPLLQLACSHPGLSSSKHLFQKPRHHSHHSPKTTNGSSSLPDRASISANTRLHHPVIKSRVKSLYQCETVKRAKPTQVIESLNERKAFIALAHQRHEIPLPFPVVSRCTFGSDPNSVSRKSSSRWAKQLTPRP